MARRASRPPRRSSPWRWDPHGPPRRRPLSPRYRPHWPALAVRLSRGSSVFVDRPYLPLAAKVYAPFIGQTFLNHRGTESTEKTDLFVPSMFLSLCPLCL